MNRRHALKSSAALGLAATLPQRAFAQQQRAICYNCPTEWADWGGMLSDAQGYYTTSWWFIIFPGLALVITTLAFNLFGDSVRDAFDPRAEQLVESWGE